MDDPATGIPFFDAVDQSTIEASIEAKAIGERIRRLRLKRSMGLVELGRQTGLSASFLSQLETGRVVPTLRNLARICIIFGKDLSYFFDETKANCFRISRAKNRTRFPLGNKKSPFLIAESLSSLVPDRRIVPCIAEFLPGFESDAFDAQTFPGMEFVYVIEGSIHVSTVAKEALLGTGDIAWIDGRPNVTTGVGEIRQPGP